MEELTRMNSGGVTASAAGGASPRGSGQVWWRRYFKGDIFIWSFAVVLTCISLLAVFSLTEMRAYRLYGGETFAPMSSHMVKLLLAWCAFVVVQMIPTRHYRTWALPLMLLGLFLLLYTVLFGQAENEAKRWISIGGYDFQPSEFVKLFVVFYLSSRLARGAEYMNRWRLGGLLGVAFVIGLTFLLIVKENNSTAILLFGLSGLMLLLGPVSRQNMAILVLVSLVLGLLFLFVIAPNVPMFKRHSVAITRLESFFSSGSGAGSGEESGSYQAVHARIAVAGGMLLGKGTGHSTQRFFLPESYVDYVYASIIEEYGLVMGVVIMGVYIGLLLRIRRIVRRCRSNLFQGYLCIGLGLLIGLQAFVHIFVSVGLFPVTGLNLPFVSMGGSSLLVTGIALGIIQSVARQQSKDLYEGERAEA